MTQSQGRIILSGDPTEHPEWEGVLDNLKVESLPIKYVSELILNLNTNPTKKVIIDVPSIIAQSPNLDQAAQRVNNIIRENTPNIITIDFKVNVSGVQKQVAEIKNAFSKRVNKKFKVNNAERKRKQRDQRK